MQMESLLREYPHLLVQSISLALCLDSVEIIERCMDQAPLERVHRIEELRASCAPYIRGGPVCRADDLLLVPHPVVLAVDDHLDVRIEVSGIYIGDELDGIEVLALATDYDRGIIALDVDSDLRIAAERDRGSSRVAHLHDERIQELQYLPLIVVLRLWIAVHIGLLLLIISGWLRLLLRSLLSIVDPDADIALPAGTGVSMPASIMRHWACSVTGRCRNIWSCHGRK